MPTQFQSDSGTKASATFDGQALGLEGPQRATTVHDLSDWLSRQTVTYAVIMELKSGVATCVGLDGTLDDAESVLEEYGVSDNTADKTVPWVIGFLDEDVDCDVRARRANTPRLRDLIAMTIHDFFRQEKPRPQLTFTVAIRQPSRRPASR
ncbi:MAG TPA: hypothetical protein VFT87_01225 [Candidatus Saccharimonadales bacterium]|nr:hypothetical protein [Candidatus Saccharimonadales bacterium]